MTTIERITAALKTILDDDRRADRERIAELERDNATLTIQVDAIHEKCATLAEERNSLTIENNREHADVVDLNKQLDNALKQVAVLLEERESLRRQLVSVVENPTEMTTPFGVLPCDASGMRRLIDEIANLIESPTWHAAFCDWWCIVGTRRDDRVEVWGGKLGWNTIGALAYADKRDADAELKRLGRPALLDDVHVTTLSEWRRVMS